MVGRTNDITGTVTIAGGQATTADLRVGLLALTSGDAKPAPQFGISLDTQRYPDATISLTQPVTLDAAFTSGTTLTVNAAGTLTLHGVTRTVTVALSRPPGRHEHRRRRIGPGRLRRLRHRRAQRVRRRSARSPTTAWRSSCSSCTEADRRTCTYRSPMTKIAFWHAVVDALLTAIERRAHE